MWLHNGANATFELFLGAFKGGAGEEEDPNPQFQVCKQCDLTA